MSADSGEMGNYSPSSLLQTEHLRVRQGATKALGEPLQRGDSGCDWVPTIICNSEEGMERPANPWRGE
jgi:hypothetical protein